MKNTFDITFINFYYYIYFNNNMYIHYNFRRFITVGMLSTYKDIHESIEMFIIDYVKNELKQMCSDVDFSDLMTISAYIMTETGTKECIINLTKYGVDNHSQPFKISKLIENII